MKMAQIAIDSFMSQMCHWLHDSIRALATNLQRKQSNSRMPNHKCQIKLETEIIMRDRLVSPKRYLIAHAAQFKQHDRPTERARRDRFLAHMCKITIG